MPDKIGHATLTETAGKSCDRAKRTRKRQAQECLTYETEHIVHGSKMESKIHCDSPARIERLSEEGRTLADQGDTLGAWKKFVEALNIVPEPKIQWEATTRLLASIGDMAFRRGQIETARDAFMDAVRCPGGLGDVFIHLRLGQCYFELGDEHRAADNLTRAYMGGGREAFKAEDPKYFALLERLLKPPAGQDRL